MPPLLDVSQMIGAFGATYRAIDLRCVAVKQGSIWTNAYTVIRFSYEEPDVVQKRLHRLEQVYGPVRTESFRVFLDGRPFSEWEQIRSQLEADKVRVEDIDVTFQQPIWVNLSRTLAYLHNDYSAIRPFDSCKWPVAQYALHAYGTPALASAALVSETTKIGYPDPYEAVNLLCELNIQSNQSQGHQLYLSLPAFASISGFRILPKDRSLSVEIKRHNELGSLKCVVLFRGRDHQRSEPWKYRLTIEPEISENGKILTAVGSVALPQVQDDDWAEVQLLHPDLGQLCQESNSVRQLIPPAQRNILFEALKFFCPEAEFATLVVRPFDKKGPRLKESAAFELRIAWLLGLLGLSTIVLGEYEHIVAPVTGVRRGSSDILAAIQPQGKLVLVACTIGPPKDEDFTNLHTTAEILEREVFGEASVRIVLLVCTCAPGYPVQSVDGTPVLDADRLALALQLVKAGREQDVLSFIQNPSFYELRDPNQPQP
jgi:hypothetical protein